MRGSNFFLMIMSRIPPKVMLLVMLALATTATVMVQQTIEKNKPKPQIAEAVPTEAVLVSIKDIPEGTTIEQDAFKIAEMPSKEIPRGALRSSGMVLGLKAKANISANDFFFSQFLAMAERPTGFESKIREGHRAFTIPVDTNTGVAGFLTPDSHVDIMAQIGSGADSHAMVILGDVQVIAVGQQFKRMPGQSEAQPVSSVTVSVSPADAGKLANAMSSGKLYCLMRNSKDYSPVQTTDVSKAFKKPVDSIPQSDLVNVPPPILPEIPKLPPPDLPKSSAEEARLRNVDMWAGSKKDQMEFVETSGQK